MYVILIFYLGYISNFKVTMPRDTYSDYMMCQTRAT